MNLIESADALLAQYEAEASPLEVQEVIAMMKKFHFHALQTGERTYAVLTTNLTADGLDKLCALVRLEAAIAIYRDNQDEHRDGGGAA